MADVRKKTPFPTEANFSNDIVTVALELGLQILGNLGRTGKWNVEHVIISPPYIVSKDEIRRIGELLKLAIISVSERY
jgi:adenosylmethionine-8-amino-7-oxononanoate aminotransferase